VLPFLFSEALMVVPKSLIAVLFIPMLQLFHAPVSRILTPYVSLNGTIKLI